MSKHDEDNASICISRHTHLCSLVWTMHTTNWQAELSTSIICLLLTTSKAEPWEKMLIYICASTLDTPSSWLFNKYLSNKRIEISLIYQEYSDRVLYDIYCISSEWLTGCKCDSRLSLILKIISPVAFYYIFYTHTHTHFYSQCFLACCLFFVLFSKTFCKALFKYQICQLFQDTTPFRPWETPLYFDCKSRWHFIYFIM